MALVILLILNDIPSLFVILSAAPALFRPALSLHTWLKIIGPWTGGVVHMDYAFMAFRIDLDHRDLSTQRARRLTLVAACS